MEEDMITYINKAVPIPFTPPVLRASIEALGKFLCTYKISEPFNNPEYGVSKDLLRKLCSIIAMHRISLSPDPEALTETKINDWAAYHVDAFLRAVFDGTEESGPWDIRVGKPRLWLFEERKIPYESVGKCIPRPNCPAHVAEAIRPDPNGPKCCAADKEVFLLLDIDTSYLGLPNFTFTCSKLRHDKPDNQVMMLDRKVVAAASQKLLREWHINEDKVETQMSIDLTIYRARMIVWIESLPVGQRAKHTQEFIKQRPLDFAKSQVLATEQKDKATFLKGAASAYNEEERKALRDTVKKEDLDLKIRQLEVELKMWKGVRADLEEKEQQIVRILFEKMMTGAQEKSRV